MALVKYLTNYKTKSYTELKNILHLSGIWYINICP